MTSTSKPRTQYKNLLLDPTVLLPSNFHPTPLLPGPSATKRYYCCYYCNHRDDSPRSRPLCQNLMREEMHENFTCENLMREEMHVNFTSEKIETNCSGDGFVNDIVAYNIMDDLTITPASTSTLISIIMLLKNFNKKDPFSLQRRTVRETWFRRGYLRCLSANFMVLLIDLHA